MNELKKIKIYHIPIPKELGKPIFISATSRTTEILFENGYMAGADVFLFERTVDTSEKRLKEESK